MLPSKRMHRNAKLVALFALALVAGNAQCVIACGLEHSRPAEAPQSHCHHKGTPDNGTPDKSTPTKDQPTSAPCAHDISIVDSSANTSIAPPMLALVAKYSAPVTTETPQHSFHTGIEGDISPPSCSLSLISVLQI